MTRRESPREPLAAPPRRRGVRRARLSGAPPRCVPLPCKGSPQLLHAAGTSSDGRIPRGGSADECSSYQVPQLVPRLSRAPRNIPRAFHPLPIALARAVGIFREGRPRCAPAVTAPTHSPAAEQVPSSTRTRSTPRSAHEAPGGARTVAYSPEASAHSPTPRHPRERAAASRRSAGTVD